MADDAALRSQLGHPYAHFAERVQRGKPQGPHIPLIIPERCMVPYTSTLVLVLVLTGDEHAHLAGVTGFSYKRPDAQIPRPPITHSQGSGAADGPGAMPGKSRWSPQVLTNLGTPPSHRMPSHPTWPDALSTAAVRDSTDCGAGRGLSAVQDA